MTKIFVFEYLTGGGIDPAHAGAGSLADLSALIVEGRVMRDALANDLRALDGVTVSVASSRFETLAPALAHCKAAPGESMTAFVARAAREHDYAWVIAPECDGLLLRLHDAVGAARWLGCAKEAIRVASSKSATAACLAAHGIATTPAVEPGEPGEPVEHAANQGGRWVVKPDDGAGGLDTFVFDDFADACAEYEARAAAARNPVLQAWVDGEPLSLSLICENGRAEVVSVNRQQIGVSAMCDAGEAGGSGEPGSRAASVVEFDGVSLNEIALSSDKGRALAALAQRVAQALPGLRGFAGIDVVWHPARGPVVIEVNPRLTVAYAGLSATLGTNLAPVLLATHGVRLDGRDDAHACAVAQPMCGARP